MSLLNLPNELLLPIAESFEHSHEINALLLTNRRLAVLLTPLLNELALQAKYAMTALFWMAANGCEPMVKLLLTHGAGIIVVAAPSGKGAKTVLHQSPGNCSDMLVKFVMAQGVDLTLQDTHGKNWIPLHWAAKSDNLAMIKLLLDRGAEVDTRDHLGRTSLHLGSWFGPDVVRFLLENGADTSARDINGYTPLHTAVRHSKETTKVLLEKGADVNARDDNGSTPLHVAAESSRGVVNLLLEHGASVATRDNAGQTPLHLATRDGKGVGVVRLLLERGADVMAKDNMGKAVQLWTPDSHDVSVPSCFVEDGDE